MIRWLKAGARAYYRLRGSIPFEMDGVPYLGDANHAGDWHYIGRGDWEPYSLRILSRYLKPESVYCDVGAWIGPLVLYAAKRCQRVYCFEPDRTAYGTLLENIRLNDLRNVTPFNMALGASDGPRELAAVGEAFGNSQSSLVKTEGCKTVTVPCLSWATFKSTYLKDRIDFLKMDIEGGEFELLPELYAYLQEYKPHLYISFHAPYLDEEKRRTEMEKIASRLSMYKHIYTQELQVGSFDDLTDEHSLKHFREFLLTDEEA